MAKLTEQEKQEVIRYLESDKPLPDPFQGEGTKGST